jgi:DNA-binding protein H-NS
VQPKRSTLATLSNEALCQLRDEIGALLKKRADDLQRELNRLTGGAAVGGPAQGGREPIPATGKKVAPKYRGPNGETWTGRGLKPRWLTAAINDGRQLTDFLIIAAGVSRLPPVRAARRNRSTGEGTAVAL